LPQFEPAELKILQLFLQ